MAITKIWSVKSRLDTSLDYIANPEKTSLKPNIDAKEGVIKYITNADKTEQCKYVTAYGCSDDSPFSDMLETGDEGTEKRAGTATGSRDVVCGYAGAEGSSAENSGCDGRFQAYL